MLLHGDARVSFGGGDADRRGIEHMTAQRLFQGLAWLCLLAIVVLSLVEPPMRPVTILPHDFEHAAIFAFAGLAVGLGYPNHGLRNMLALTIFAGAVELAQLYVPGRHARWSDFTVDALAACIGVALAVATMRLRLRAVALGRIPIGRNRDAP
jgi:VanZ family protein